MGHPVNQDGTPVGYGTGLPEGKPATPASPPPTPAITGPVPVPHGPPAGVDDLGRRIVDDASLDVETLQQVADEWGGGGSVDDARLASARHAGRALNQASAGLLDQMLQTTSLGDGPHATVFLEALAVAMTDIDDLTRESIPTDRRESAMWMLDFMSRRVGTDLKAYVAEAKLNEDGRLMTVLASAADLLGKRTAVPGASPVAAQRAIDAIMSDQKFLRGEYPKPEHERLTAKLRDLYGLLHG